MVSGALSNLKVLDIGHYIAGPYCAKLMADMGADVVKVEPPDGDPARKIWPFLEDLPDPEKSGRFHWRMKKVCRFLITGDRRTIGHLTARGIRRGKTTDKIVIVGQ